MTIDFSQFDFGPLWRNLREMESWRVGERKDLPHDEISNVYLYMIILLSIIFALRPAGLIGLPSSYYHY